MQIEKMYNGNDDHLVNEEFMKHFSWVREMLNREPVKDFHHESAEYEILSQLKNTWGEDNGIESFKALDKKYGEAAKQTMTEFLKVNLLRDWTGIGEKESHAGTEIDDFFRVLWEPLQELGFEYIRKSEGDVVETTVTKCPVFELAEKTGMHQWFFLMACTSDYFTTPSFSREIGFLRTRTMMQGDEYCNHTYFYKKAVTDDMRLGFCGLYCGNCPNYQRTDAAIPINFDNDNFYEPCLGCNSKIKTEHCTNCEIITCNTSRNTRTCYECKDFPCTIMDDFINDTRYPYHAYVEKNMQVLQEKGLPEWAAIQREKYICNKCNAVLNFFQNKCTDCGSPLEL